MCSDLFSVYYAHDKLDDFISTINRHLQPLFMQIRKGLSEDDGRAHYALVSTYMMLPSPGLSGAVPVRLAAAVEATCRRGKWEDKLPTAEVHGNGTWQQDCSSAHLFSINTADMRFLFHRGFLSQD